MSISLNSSFMAYAKSMEGKSLEGYFRLSSKILRSKAGNSNVAASASQKSDEAENVRNLFSGINVTDAEQLSKAFKQYKSMMTVAYKAVGFGYTTNSMLNNDTSSFTKQVSNMKAVLSGINRNGIDSMF